MPPVFKSGRRRGNNRPTGSQVTEIFTPQIYASLPSLVPPAEEKNTSTSRWLESNIGAVAVSKHEMQKVRQAQQMYNEGIPINEITQSMKLSEAQLSQLLNYNTHALSLDQLIEDDFSSEGGDQPHCSMEYGVMLKIWLSLLPEV